MAVPKRKKTASKRDMRRANHDRVTPIQLVACQNCGEAMRAHRACGACGFYKGRKAQQTASDEG